MLEYDSSEEGCGGSHFLHRPDEALLSDLHGADTRTSDGQVLIWLGNGIENHRGGCENKRGEFDGVLDGWLLRCWWVSDKSANWLSDIG